jgi:hypothetical protein
VFGVTFGRTHMNGENYMMNSVIICSLLILLGLSNKNDEMHGACTRCRGKNIQNSTRNSQGKRLPVRPKCRWEG